VREGVKNKLACFEFFTYFETKPTLTQKKSPCIVQNPLSTSTFNKPIFVRNSLNGQQDNGQYDVSQLLTYFEFFTNFEK
jgi:hypothetical protein